MWRYKWSGLFILVILFSSCVMPKQNRGNYHQGELKNCESSLIEMYNELLPCERLVLVEKYKKMSMECMASVGWDMYELTKIRPGYHFGRLGVTYFDFPEDIEKWEKALGCN